MTKKHNFKVNEKLEIALEEEEHFYKSMIQDMEKGSITVGLPINNNKSLLLYQGDKIKVKKIEDDAVYYYTSKVISRLKDDNVPLYNLEEPRISERLQRRKYVRVPCVLPVKYRYHQKEISRQEGHQEFKFQEGLTVDIGGGGIKFSSELNIPPGQFLDINVVLPDFVLNARAKVVRTIELKERFNKDNINYWICVEFFSICEKDREKFISFIFERMREGL